MNKTPNNPVVIFVSDVFAFVIRKALLVLVICIIGAFLSVGVHYVLANSEKAQEKYNLELEEYTSNLEETKNKLEVSDSTRRNLVASMEEDPAVAFYKGGKVFESKSSFVISSDDESLISDNGGILYPNQEKLEAYFLSLDLSGLLGVSVKKTYLDSLILFSAQKNHIVVTAYSDSLETASSWCNIVFEKLEKYADEQGWTLSNKSINTEPYFGDYIVKIIDDYNQLLAKQEKESIQLGKTLRDMEAKRPSPLHILRFFVLGFVLFGFVSLFIIIVIFVKKYPISKSFVADKMIGAPFLGALFAANHFFDKLARGIISERKFASESEAIEYIKGNIRTTSLKDDSVKNVVILCSCKSKDVEKQAKTLESILAEFGCKATLVTDVSVNPESADVVSSTDAVILLERQWVSQWKLVGVSMDLAERFDKPVVGFVLC